LAKLVELLQPSPGMEEVRITAWHKTEGALVAVGDLLAEVENDKATMELRSVDEGTLLRILAPPGTLVKLGQPVAVIGNPGEDIAHIGRAAAGAPGPADPPASASAAARCQATNGPESISTAAASRFHVDADIRRARALPAEVYHDAACFRLQAERVFQRTWHVAVEQAAVAAPGSAVPLTLLPGALDEPLLVTRDNRGALHGLSNVCTHRGNLLVDEPCRVSTIRCRYHGRRFELDGRMTHMPEFEAAEGFPSPSDDLPRVALGSWGPLLFAALDPAVGFDELLAPVRARLAGLGLDALVLDPATSRDYLVEASWIAYCDNYLEGFHIPFVHPALGRAIDYATYTTETLPMGSLQIAIAAAGEPAFDPPASHPDAGRRVAAYYYHLFPATMLNVYPWGVSVNAVRPVGPDRTRVSFLSLVAHPSKRAGGASADLDRVEAEDEAVVERVQRGVRSRLYRGGRFSPTREIGVHHFHRMLGQYLDVDGRER
jgi:choline monooxygenase